MLVSAVMPTRGRTEYSRISLHAWREQSYKNRELIVVDHSTEPSFPDGIFEEGIQYSRTKETRIGALRNLGCILAWGEIIVNWDSDDSYGPHRMADQVERLESTGKAVTGYKNILFSDGERTWLNTNWPGGYGASLCFRKSWWESHPFPDSNEEDWAFVSEAMRLDQFAVADAGTHMIATIHAGNTAKRMIGQGWIPVS